MTRFVSLAAACSMALLAFVFHSPRDTPDVQIPGKNREGKEQHPLSGPERERKYFADWHRPYDAALPSEVMQQIWSEVGQIPSEEHLDSPPPNAWSLVGPVYMELQDGRRFTGRILDLELEHATALPRFAAASGGLWALSIFGAGPLSEKLTSQAIGSFDSHPTNGNEILVGTGEPWLRTGTGLWRTTNGGATWSQITMTPQPEGFYKLRYHPGNPSIVHAATTSGYYRSIDGGVTWFRIITHPASDLAFHPTNPNIMFTCFIGASVSRSTNGGLTWTMVLDPLFPPDSIVGRTSIAFAPSSPNTIYMSMASRWPGIPLLGYIRGVFKSVDGGQTWSDVRPQVPEDPFGGQGGYNNTISVSPVNHNLVLFGGVNMYRTSNGGVSWSTIPHEVLHVDHHAMQWSSDGSTVWVGNDGGFAYSTNQGVSWTTGANAFPITQYVNCDVDWNDPRIVAGGSQDNGLSLTTDGGTTWKFIGGADGGGIAFDVSTQPADARRMWVTNGFYFGNISFKPLRTTDHGANWAELINGLDPSSHWYPKIRTDRLPPVYLYYNDHRFVYRSTNFGNQWTKLNAQPIQNDIQTISVSLYQSGSSVVYAALDSFEFDDPGRLMVYDGGTWFERSAGLPQNLLVRNVATHITNSNVAYALMLGWHAGQKVFKTTNRGVSWSNISGNLPNVPLADLLAHPTNDNLLYLGTEMGSYRTTNGGSSWHRWNNGMPEASIVTELKWIDSLAINGKFYVVASTYGRGIWKREVSGDDPVTVRSEENIPEVFALSQNFPNPFNPVTSIQVDIPVKSEVRLVVFDIQGREVATLLSGEHPAGRHIVIFNGRNLASGTYFYQLRGRGFVATKKMLMVK